MPTTWSLNKQCVEVFEVTDDALQQVLSVSEMLDRRRNCQALTQSEVLHFVGWWPFRTSDEFDQYHADHPDLEPFPPTDYGFGTSEHTIEVELSTEEVFHRAPRLT